MRVLRCKNCQFNENWNLTFTIGPTIDLGSKTHKKIVWCLQRLRLILCFFFPFPVPMSDLDGVRAYYCSETAWWQQGNTEHLLLLIVIESCQMLISVDQIAKHSDQGRFDRKVTFSRTVLEMPNVMHNAEYAMTSDERVPNLLSNIGQKLMGKGVLEYPRLRRLPMPSVCASQTQ